MSEADDPDAARQCPRARFRAKAPAAPHAPYAPPGPPRACCTGGMPSFSSTHSLMRSIVSVGSMSISISFPVSVFTCTGRPRGDSEGAAARGAASRHPLPGFPARLLQRARRRAARLNHRAACGNDVSDAAAGEAGAAALRRRTA